MEKCDTVCATFFELVDVVTHYWFADKARISIFPKSWKIKK